MVTHWHQCSVPVTTRYEVPVIVLLVFHKLISATASATAPTSPPSALMGFLFGGGDDAVSVAVPLADVA